MRPRSGTKDVCACIFALVALTGVGRPFLAWGYRPFVSTDAAVADPNAVELELGYFNLERSDKENTFLVPQVVLNYGLFTDWELVGEFVVEEPPGQAARLADPGVFLKAVLKEGVLQQKTGPSFAVEAGALLPSTVREQRGGGFEGLGILSGRFSALTYHLNVGGGVDRHNTDPFVIWGVILELPVTPSFRFVGEISGESVRKRLPDESALLGFIWQPWSSPVSVDSGLRKGLSKGAPDWRVTIGLTAKFSLPSFLALGNDRFLSGEQP
jgi:hypothetical protein